jgi:hypothetical protein
MLELLVQLLLKEQQSVMSKVADTVELTIVDAPMVVRLLSLFLLATLLSSCASIQPIEGPVPM